jgi:hypothetical protein
MFFINANIKMNKAYKSLPFLRSTMFMMFMMKKL